MNSTFYLDEAQMIESTTTKTAEMALRLSAVNKGNHLERKYIEKNGRHTVQLDRFFFFLYGRGEGG